MDLTLITPRIFEIITAIRSDLLVYLPLIGAWLITASYFILNHDEKHGHAHVVSTGIAHIFTAYMISPFAIPDIQWSFSDTRTIVVAALFVYGVFLIILGISKAFPDLLAEFFGDPGHALVPSLMAVLYVQENIPFDWLTFFIIAVPVLILSAIKISRKFRRK